MRAPETWARSDSDATSPARSARTSTYLTVGGVRCLRYAWFSRANEAAGGSDSVAMMEIGRSPGERAPLYWGASTERAALSICVLLCPRDSWRGGGIWCGCGVTGRADQGVLGAGGDDDALAGAGQRSFVGEPRGPDVLEPDGLGLGVQERAGQPGEPGNLRVRLDVCVGPRFVVGHDQDAFAVRQPGPEPGEDVLDALGLVEDVSEDAVSVDHAPPRGRRRRPGEDVGAHRVDAFGLGERDRLRQGVHAQHLVAGGGEFGLDDRVAAPDAEQGGLVGVIKELAQ